MFKNSLSGLLLFVLVVVVLVLGLTAADGPPTLQDGPVHPGAIEYTCPFVRCGVGSPGKIERIYDPEFNVVCYREMVKRGPISCVLLPSE